MKALRDYVGFKESLGDDERLRGNETGNVWPRVVWRSTAGRTTATGEPKILWRSPNTARTAADRLNATKRVSDGDEKLAFSTNGSPLIARANKSRHCGEVAGSSECRDHQAELIRAWN